MSLRLLPEIYLNQLSTNDIGEPVLENFMRKNANLTDQDKIKLLQQMAYCLMRFDDEEFRHNVPLDSQLFFIGNFIGSNENKINMRFLANFYCFLLTSGTEYSVNVTETQLKCPYPDVALHLIGEMVNEPFEIGEVVQHPFHWGDQQKVLFLCRAFDFVNAKINNKTPEEIVSILDGYSMSESGNVLPDGGWIQMLKLTNEELMRLPKKNGQYRVRAPRKLIFKLAGRSNGYRERSIFELLRFFRNRYAHFDEDSENVKMCFESLPAGYLRFFTSRFPKLFLHVYSNMKTYICKKGYVGEFANLGFDQPLFNVNMYIR